jgi:hypothetical protein
MGGNGLPNTITCGVSVVDKLLKMAILIPTVCCKTGLKACLFTHGCAPRTFDTQTNFTIRTLFGIVVGFAADSPKLLEARIRCVPSHEVINGFIGILPNQLDHALRHSSVRIMPV